MLRVDTCAIVCVASPSAPALASAFESQQRGHGPRVLSSLLKLPPPDPPESNRLGPEVGFQAEPEEPSSQLASGHRGQGAIPGGVLSRCLPQGWALAALVPQLSRCQHQEDAPCPQKLREPLPSPVLHPGQPRPGSKELTLAGSREGDQLPPWARRLAHTL